jgi:bifunctional non-homologous end joining protein LigD
MLHRTLPAGFVAPCLPTKTDKLPSGGLWLHEIKHDGFRIIARKDGERVRLYSRPGNDFSRRFPLIVETLARLRSRSCIIDGEAVACGRWWRMRSNDATPLSSRFRPDRVERRGHGARPRFEVCWPKLGLGLRFNEHIEGAGPTVFAHACKVGLEGIVSKRKDSTYRSGRSPD